MGDGQSVVLTVIERDEFQLYEQTIERGLKTFVDVGMALMAIRDKRLYKQDYRTFEDYLERRWQMSRQRGYQLIEAAEINRNLSTIVDKLPSSESQARPLTRLKEPERQQDAWQKAVETAPEGKVTATHVQAVVEEMTREPEQAEPSPSKLRIHHSSETPEHYTPADIIDAVLECLGFIDLDPCSNSHDEPNVPAKHHFTIDDDGLSQEWHGLVYMNPPYGREIGEWVGKLCAEHEAGRVTEAIALVPARPDTQWWKMLRDYPVCFIEGRLTFVGNDDPAPFPSAIFYLGNEIDRFYYEFCHLGDIWQRIEPGMFGE